MKDTNPDHYKVDGADFIKYMDDPKIKGFGDWMFANGFNMGEMQATTWIKCEYKMPEERESIFAKLKGTDKWTKAMFEKSSEDVRIVEEFEDGTRRVYHSNTIDGKWAIEKSPIKRKVTHWMPNPELPKLDK